MADFSTVRQDECRDAKLPEGCELGVSRTVVLQSVLNEIKEHGRASMHKEVCGVLVGSLCWDGGAYLLIDGRIEGKHASHQSGSVTFTSETWDFIHGELEAKHPKRIIVGWYHTHPGFGIFLSNMDAFIHENFFSFPWEPAYVFDPQAETDGFFFHIGGELVQEEVCIIPDAAPSVKEPMVGNSIPGKIVVEGPRRWRYVFPFAIAVLVICCLVAAVIFSWGKIRATEEEARAAERKAEDLRGIIADKDTEIKRCQLEANGWHVRKATYERELDGLRIKVTTITAERKDLETSNKEKQLAVDQLKSRCGELEKEIRECEVQISNRTTEVNRAKAELDSARKQMRQLEQRIKEQEESAARAEAASQASPRNDVSPPPAAPPPPPSTSPEKKTEEERPWYHWLKFWE